MENAPEHDSEDLCGYCDRPGADKVPSPVKWPGEIIPRRQYVHADCEQEAAQIAMEALSDAEREAFLRSIQA